MLTKTNTIETIWLLLLSYYSVGSSRPCQHSILLGIGPTQISMKFNFAHTIIHIHVIIIADNHISIDGQNKQIYQNISKYKQIPPLSSL